MDGLRIRFPGSAISNNDGDGTSDLSSFNLSLGSLGQARLVTSLVEGQKGCPDTGRISVVLSVLPNCYEGCPLKMTACQLVVDGEGQKVGQVRMMTAGEDSLILTLYFSHSVRRVRLLLMLQMLKYPSLLPPLLMTHSLYT